MTLDLGVAGAVTVDRTVLLFGLAAPTVAACCSASPAHQLAGPTSTAISNRARHQQRSSATDTLVLVAGEIALSLVLLVGAGLTIRSFIKLQNEAPGSTGSRGHGRCQSPGAVTRRRRKGGALAAQRRRATTGARRRGGGGISRLPLLPGNHTGADHSWPSVEGGCERALPTGRPPDYLTMEIPLLRGRLFEATEKDAPVALITRLRRKLLAQSQSHR